MVAMNKQQASTSMLKGLTKANYPYNRAMTFASNPRHVDAFLRLTPTEQSLWDETVLEFLNACNPLYFPDLKEALQKKSRVVENLRRIDALSKSVTGTPVRTTK